MKVFRKVINLPIVASHDDSYRWRELADYNTRVSHGVVHTPEYVEWMKQEQAAFDEEIRTAYPQVWVGDEETAQ